MSNYTVVVYDRRAAAAIARWLERNQSPPSERFEAELPRRRRMLIVSRDVGASVSGDTYFRGTAVSPEANAIAFGIRGWKQLPRDIDEHGVAGEFVTARWTRANVRIRRDVFSSVGLMYTQGRGFVAASDSLLVLADLRSALGAPTTQHSEALIGRSVMTGHAIQQMSPETYFSEILWVPASRGLSIELDGRLRALVDGPTITERVVGHDQDYVSTLRSAAGFVTGSAAAIGSIGGWQAKLNLSGGYDSRIILAGAIASGAKDNFAFSTSGRIESHLGDLRVAQELAARFGFCLNDFVVSSDEVDPNVNPVSIWASTSLGVYDRLVPVTSKTSAARVVELTGLGGEILKGNWGWTDASAITGIVPPDDARHMAFSSQILKGIASVGAQPTWSDASELQYIGYRNGIHGAGYISTGMTGIRLLQQVRMACLAHKRTDSQGDPLVNRDNAVVYGGVTAITDMLSIISPDLAVMPYDSEWKTLHRGAIDERVSLLGGTLHSSEFADVRIFGNPADVPAGPSALGIAIANRRGFDIDSTPHELLKAARMGLEAVAGNAARSVCADVVANAEWKMLVKNLPPDLAGASTPKALSLLALVD